MKQTHHKTSTISLTILLCTISLSLSYAGNIPHTDKKTVDSLLVYSFQHFLKQDTEENIKAASEALRISKAIDYSGGKAKSYFYLARALSYLGEYNKSLEYLQLSEQEPYIINNVDIHSEICRIRGQVFMYLGLPTAAINEFHKGLGYVSQIKEADKRKYCTSLVYENLSISYKNDLQHDSMFYYLNKNKEVLRDQNFPNNSYNKLNLYTLYGNYYTQVEKYDSANYFFSKALGIAKENGLDYTSWAYKHRGDMQYKQNNPDSALTYYQLALKNLTKTQMINEFSELYKQIAKVYEMKGISDSVKIYKNKAVEIDNKLFNEKQKTIENALKIIIEEEKSKLDNSFRDKFRRLAYIIAGISMVGVIVWLRWRSVQRKKIGKFEKKVEDLQLRLTNNIQEAIELAKANDSTFITRFMNLFPGFTKNIYEKHPDLISSEFWFCAMIFLDFSSKEIAQYSFVEHRSVQIRKSRLRKKLKIDSETDLYYYIKSFQIETPTNS